jgi:hypothetical protein
MTQDFSKDDICITIFISSRGLIMMNKSSLSLVQSVDHDEQIFTLIGPIRWSWWTNLHAYWSSLLKFIQAGVFICWRVNNQLFFRKDLVFTLFLLLFCPVRHPSPLSHNTCQYLLSDRLNPPATIVHEYGEFSARNPGSFDRGRFVANNPSYRLLIGSEERWLNVVVNILCCNNLLFNNLVALPGPSLLQKYSI